MDLFPDLSKVLREGLGQALKPEANTFVDMLADTIVFEFPYALPEGVKQIVGKADLEAYLAGVAQLIVIEYISLKQVILSQQATSAVLEFSCKGHVKETGKPYDQDYISVIELKSGLITRYRDYWNPLILLSATSKADNLLALLSQGETHES